jgi:hypothetical protein
MCRENKQLVLKLGMVLRVLVSSFDSFGGQNGTAIVQDNCFLKLTFEYSTLNSLMIRVFYKSSDNSTHLLHLIIKTIDI